MTIGPDSFGNGSAKTEDRFSAQLGGYRKREGSPLPGNDHSTDEFSPRNGNALGLDRVTMPLDNSPIAASLGSAKLGDGDALSDSPLAGLGPLSEPMFGRDSWLDAPSGSLADHPLLRGLLLELPPKGTIPQQEWLDRWFEAARSILELLYSQEARA